MNGYNEGRHRRLKGNAVLTTVTVVLFCAVIASAVLLFKKTPAATPALAGTSQQSSTTTAQSSSKTSGTSSGASSNTSSTEAVASSLKDALFIGDSFTSGLTLYGGIDKTDVISGSGMSAYSSLLYKYTIDSKKLKVSVAVTTKNPGSIYVLLGSNDISQGYLATTYTKYYRKLITSLQTACPNAKIYVQSVFPVTAAYEQKVQTGNKSSVTNAKIEKYNTALKSLCSEKGATYLDVASVLKDDEGKLPSAASSDGMHLKKAYYTKWMSYLAANK